MSDAYLCATYSRLIRYEQELVGASWDVPESAEIYGAAKRILEVAKNSLVLRFWNVNYNVVDVTLAPTPKEATTAARESVGAHTNLVLALVDFVLDCRYGHDWRYTDDGYTHREITEAIRRHDLPENVTGDTADDGTRNETAKVEAEQKYQKWYSRLTGESDFERHVQCLLAEMEGKTSSTGKLLYCADKLALIVAGLCYDVSGISPTRRSDDANTTERDRREMAICVYNAADNAYYASEMWTIDYLKVRRIIQYDDTGCFTALLIMCTLLCNGEWYAWRKQDYKLDYKL